MTPTWALHVVLREREETGFGPPRLKLDWPGGGGPDDRAMFARHLFLNGITHPSDVARLYREHRERARAAAAKAAREAV